MRPSDEKGRVTAAHTKPSVGQCSLLVSTTYAYSSTSTDMAEAFVKIFQCDYGYRG